MSHIFSSQNLPAPTTVFFCRLLGSLLQYLTSVCFLIRESQSLAVSSAHWITLKLSTSYCEFSSLIWLSPLTNRLQYLPPLDRLPSELISSVMNGQSLQGLTPDQMEPIKQYYLNTVGHAHFDLWTLANNSNDHFDL